MGKRILMCRPTFFDIDYEINPWMHCDNRVRHDLAQQQWQALHDIYVQQLGWQVDLVEPVPGLPEPGVHGQRRPGDRRQGGAALLPPARAPARDRRVRGLVPRPGVRRALPAAP